MRVSFILCKVTLLRDPVCGEKKSAKTAYVLNWLCSQLRWEEVEWEGLGLI